MKKITLISFIFIFSINTAFCEFDKDKIKDYIDLYLELITNYSNAPNSEIAQDKRRELYLLFEVPQLPYAFDLFDFESPTSKTGESYLRIIDTEFENKIQVDFGELYIYSCVDKKNGKEFALVSVSKQLSYIGNKAEYKGKQRNVKLLIAVNITTSDYKINYVTFPEEYGSLKGSNCVIDEKQDTQNELFQNYYSQGEQAIKQKDYIVAKQCFEKALLFKSNDSKVLRFISECNSQLNYTKFRNEAEKLFSERRYSEAKELFESIRFNYPENSDFAEKKIIECENQIRINNYLEYKKIGDDNFEKQFYTTASEFYLTAMKYNPDDSYLQNMIKKCNNADKSTVLKEISKARTLVLYNDKKNFPEIIRIYSYFEPSGLLTGQDYYNMAAILDVGYNNVCKALGFSKDQSFHLAKEYCLKSRAKRYKSADVLWFDRFNNKSRNR